MTARPENDMMSLKPLELGHG